LEIEMSDIDDAIAQAPPRHQVMHPTTGALRACADAHEAAALARKWASRHPGFYVPIYTHETSIRAPVTSEKTDAHG
jgi:hypothetical protein